MFFLGTGRTKPSTYRMRSLQAVSHEHGSATSRHGDRLAASKWPPSHGSRIGRRAIDGADQKDVIASPRRDVLKCAAPDGAVHGRTPCPGCAYGSRFSENENLRVAAMRRER